MPCGIKLWRRNGKRQGQHQSAKSSRSSSPERAQDSGAEHGDSFGTVQRTPPPNRVGPPPSPPVPMHPVAPVSPEPSGPLPLVPCAVCGRTFVPQSLAKHVKICEKMTVKKRKTFDSSRQRREGTDLEQYLPKNFGLPENSPFLEKSPPPTAKPTPKPKPHSIRNAITKPSAELQKCPHCNRAFGPRAFERHVEWCADKAKILPAAPAQPPPHIADAKQRLNARTQYKAPPVRGRRSSQTREKQSNSRSGSVDSSRGVSPPPPREYGDYRHGRTRASESASSNDCNEETPTHVPVIRNTRNSQNSTSGDANVKARQARLARDLSSSRSTQDPHSSQIQQSNTDPNITKVEKAPQSKPRNKLNAKKQLQLKKLEEIANKYNERKEKINEDKKNYRKKGDKSQIPIPKKIVVKQFFEETEDLQVENIIDKVQEDKKDIVDSPDIKSYKNKSKCLPEIMTKIKTTKNKVSEKEKKTQTKMRRNIVKIAKENSMSLDSLEEPPSLACDKNHQSIGINTELLCTPCVIHENSDCKKSARKKKNTTRDKSCSKDAESDVSEPKIELLYKNPTMISSCDLGARDLYMNNSESKEDVALSISKSLFTSTISDNFVSDNFDSSADLHNSNGKRHTNTIHDSSEDNLKSNKIGLIADEASHVSNSTNEKLGEADELANLSGENYDDNDARDVSAEIFDCSDDNKFNDDINETNLESRHGSSETYTKFTDHFEDLEEFLTLTDKMIDGQNNKHENFDVDKHVEDFHTPKTNSLEAINKDTVEKKSTDKHTFSDSFQELKSNLKQLLDAEVVGKSMENENDKTEKKHISDLEHITVYELNYFGQTSTEQIKNKISNKEKEKINLNDFKLPSIAENNKPDAKVACNKKRMQRIYKPNKKYKLLTEHTRAKTFILDQTQDETSDEHSISSEAPPLKLPRIENKRIDDTYDPFVSAARQMKELMSPETNIPKKIQTSSKDSSRTLPILRPTKEKTKPSLQYNTEKVMKDTLNKTYQKTPTLQRMKSFGSSNNENNNNSMGGRCSSFRINRNDKKSTQKLNTTFTKSSKENISTADKNYFNRNSSLNRSFSSYTTSSYNTPKPKDKIPKIATSMYHSFQRTTIKQPVKLDKIKRDDETKGFVNLDVLLTGDNFSMTDSNYIDPRLINENDNLPINVKTILNNPDIISSMESLLTTENLPAKFESFSANNKSNNNKTYNGLSNGLKIDKKEANNNKTIPPTIDNLSAQYDKIMSSLEQSIASKTSVRDDDSLCEDFDLEEFMTTFDEEIYKQKTENKRTCSSTTRVVKQSELTDSNRTSELNSISSSPKVANGLLPVNKSMSLNFSSNNIVNENLFPSSVKRSTSLLDSLQKKSAPKDGAKNRQKVEQLEQDIMQSLKDFDKFYEPERNENSKTKDAYNGTAKRDTRVKTERRVKNNDNTSNGNHTPNGKLSNDSAYSSLNRVSPSKLSICNTKESNGLASLDQIPVGSDSSYSHKEDIRSVSSEEFLAMERSTEYEQPLPQRDNHNVYKESDNHTMHEKVGSRASSRRSTGAGGGVASRVGAAGGRGSRAGSVGAALSSSGSESSLARGGCAAPRLSRFCHECGSRFPVDSAKFCIHCGVKRLVM